jgi:hypothetical protein
LSVAGWCVKTPIFKGLQWRLSHPQSGDPAKDLLINQVERCTVIEMIQNQMGSHQTSIILLKCLWMSAIFPAIGQQDVLQGLTPTIQFCSFYCFINPKTSQVGDWQIYTDLQLWNGQLLFT